MSVTLNTIVPLQYSVGANDRDIEHQNPITAWFGFQRLRLEQIYNMVLSVCYIAELKTLPIFEC